jgi:mRNA interferase YafQ
MLKPFYAKQFRKDVKKIEKSGDKDIEKLKTIIRFLIKGSKLDIQYRDHELTGNFRNRRECHIEPDWLLVYKMDKKEKIIIFERTGSHAEIFE